jgi:hypothetical protein
MRKQVLSAFFIVSALSASAALAQTATDRAQERLERSPSRDMTTGTVDAPVGSPGRSIAPTQTDRAQERLEADPSRDMTTGTVAPPPGAERNR